MDKETTVDYNAYSLGKSEITSSIRFTDANNKFDVILKSSSDKNSGIGGDYNQPFTITIRQGWKDLNGIIDAINADLKNHEVVVGKDKSGNDIKVGLDTRIKAVADGNYIKIVDNEDLTLDNAEDMYPNWKTDIDLESSGSNAGYRILFQERREDQIAQTYTFTQSVTLSGSQLTGPVTFYINGKRHTIGSAGQTPEQAKNAYEYQAPKTFPSVSSKCENKPQNFTVSGEGTTKYTYWAGDSASGKAYKPQGSSRYDYNTPATLEVGPAKIPSSIVVDKYNDKITLGLNGTDYTFELAHGTYNQDGLADALQKAIDDKAGKEFGGAVVEIKNNQFVITSRLGKRSQQDGAHTSIISYAQGQKENTFFESLDKTETAASCTSKMAVKDNVDLTTANDTFEFSFTDKDGNDQNVSFHLLEASESGGTSISKETLISRINTKLNADGATYKGKVEASLDSSNHLVLTTTEAGEKTRIKYTTGPEGGTKANAKAIFGDIDTGVTSPAAQITLNQTALSAPYGGTFTGTKNFVVNIDGANRTFYVNSWLGVDDLVTQLNQGITVGGVKQKGLKDYGVTATQSGGIITLTRDVQQSGTSLAISYDGSAGSAMGDIFGKMAASIEDDVQITATANGLTITALDKDGNVDPHAGITISSDQTGGLTNANLQPKTVVSYWDHARRQGFHSAKFSTVTSVDLSGYAENGKVAIELNKWNNELEFEFTENWAAATSANPPTVPTWNPVSFRLTESGAGNKTSIDDIVKELQTKIDASKVGKDKIEVLFENNRLMLKSAKPGAQFQFRGMVSSASGGSASLDATNKIGGGFFHHVMCKSEEQKGQLADPTDINGDQFPDEIFAMGRHDVVFNRASLHPGTSDTLILDLNYFEDKNHDGVLDADKNKNGKLDGDEWKDVKTISLKLEMKADTPPQYWIDSSKDEVVTMLRKYIKGSD